MKIRQGAYDALVAHAVEDLPNECCGLLIGTEEMVVEAVRTRNALGSSRTAFKVHPADHFAAIRRARAAGLAIVGAYHSHPNGPSAPSEKDRARLTDPAMFHVIVSLAAGTRTVRAFQLIDRNFTPMEFVPVP